MNSYILLCIILQEILYIGFTDKFISYKITLLNKCSFFKFLKNKIFNFWIVYHLYNEPIYKWELTQLNHREKMWLEHFQEMGAT